MLNPVSFQRAAHWCHQRHIPLVPRLIEFMIFAMFNCVLRAETKFGRSVRLAYKGLGVVIHKRAVIGDNVLIGTCVTIGGSAKSEGVPVIESDCFIATGAKVLGDIVVGGGSVVGANAVVLHDVPRRSLAVGVPATVARTDIDINDYVDPWERGL